MRIEPPPSPPVANGTTPAATSAAEPPLDPPGVRETSHGLRVMPVSGPCVIPFQPNSGVVVLQKNTAPASRRRATPGVSSALGEDAVACEPIRVGQPLTCAVSLIATGTPSSGPIGSPRRQRSADATASPRPCASSSRQIALSAGLTASNRANVASSTSTGDRSPVAKPLVSSRAESQFSSSATLFSRFARGHARLDIALQDVSEAVERAAQRDAPGQFDDLGFGEMFTQAGKDFVAGLAPVVIDRDGIFDDELVDGIELRMILVVEQP